MKTLVILLALLCFGGPALACDIEGCVYKCCDSKGNCPIFPGDCRYTTCQAQYCSTGCCVNRRCGSQETCNQVFLIVGLIVLGVDLLLVLGCCCVYCQQQDKFKARVSQTMAAASMNPSFQLPMGQPMPPPMYPPAFPPPYYPPGPPPPMYQN
eukprot:TRINITY_DN9193_c0_g1_i5.p3 TRINITY_DN9193_c0_g1~~TRINITY_DN9193_c0_g1_i5.p3  ORF type:complete len:153 (+),score=14.94 TRINITY_DN9193_c0_g1_i5:101-559(+)